MSEEYLFDNFSVHSVNKLLSFAESVEECKTLGSKLLNVKTLENKSVEETIKLLDKKYDLFQYIVSLYDNNTDCFGLLNVNLNILENIEQICRGDYEYDQKYYALCQKNITSSLHKVEPDNYNNDTSVVITILIVAFFLIGIVLISMFVYRRRCSPSSNNILVEEEENTNQVSFIRNICSYICLKLISRYVF